MPTANSRDRVTEAPRSQSSWVYQTVREDIIAGRYRPGEKLKIQDLAASLQVSPGAVREALSISPIQGTTVLIKGSRGIRLETVVDLL